MDNSIVFTPATSDLWWGVALCLGIIIACVIGGLRLSNAKTTDARLKVVLPMLFYFGALLGLMGAAGNILSWYKYPHLEFAGSRLMINGEEHPKPRPDKWRVEKVGGGLGGERRILLLEVSGGKTYALPDERYPLSEIIVLLK